MSQPDYYAILSVSRDANDATIKKAYKTMALKYHPDKTRGDPESNLIFQQVSEAYECLKDPASRVKYDRGVYDPSGQGDQDDMYQEAPNMRRHHANVFAGRRGGGSAFDHHRYTMQSALGLFESFFGSMEDDFMGHGRMGGSPFGGDPFFSRMDEDPFGGFGMLGRAHGRSNRGGNPFASAGFLDEGFGQGRFQGVFSSSFSSSSSTSGGGFSSKSVSTQTSIDSSGRRVAKTTTTVRHPDGRVETNTTTDDGSSSQMGRLPASHASSLARR